MKEEILYKTPIVNSWGAVTLVNHCGLITPDHPKTVIFLDENGRPRHLGDAKNEPLKTKALIVVQRRTGDPHPTEIEIEECKAWKEICNKMGDVKLADFIIMSGAHHYSFADETVQGPGPKGF